MLIELKVKTELPVVLLLFRSLEWFKQVSDIVHGEQRATQDPHDFHDGTTDLPPVFVKESNILSSKIAIETP